MTSDVKDNGSPDGKTECRPPDLFADPYFVRQFMVDAEASVALQRGAELVGPEPFEPVVEARS